MHNVVLPKISSTISSKPAGSRLTVTVLSKLEALPMEGQAKVLSTLEALEGPSHGPCYSEFDQFNRSSMMFPRPMNSAETVEYVLRIVAQADHEMLLRSGNEAYANALSSHNGTKAELASLQYVLIMFITPLL